MKRRSPMRRSRMRSRREMAAVGINEAGQITHIFRGSKQAVQWAIATGLGWKEMPRDEAVFKVRMAVFGRSEDLDGNHCCFYCGKGIPWEVGHMHEQVPRGKGLSPGIISIDNSVWACPDCHMNHPMAHGDRRLHWSKSQLK